MPRQISESEDALIELVHFLVLRSGLPVNKVKMFLNTKVDGTELTVLDHLDSEGKAFVNRLKIFINQSES